MKNTVNNEVSLVFLIKKLINSVKLIFISSIIFSLIGIFVALKSPIEYKSSTVFIPQNQKQSSSISGVASLVGINLGSPTFGGDIPSSLYPQISESTKFKRLVLDSYIDLNSKSTLKEFLIEYYHIDNNSEEISSNMSISKLEESCFNLLSNIISIRVNEKDGFVTIDVLTPVAEYSAILANTAKSVLQQIIIENKIENAQQTLNYSKDQLNSKMMEFEQIKSKLSNFKDSNLNLVNSLIKYDQEKLEAEFDIINAVIIELSKQVEQAKLQVKKDTPVFSTIKEPVIANYRTNPKRTLIVITYALIGFILSVIYSLIKDPIVEFLILLKK